MENKYWFLFKNGSILLQKEAEIYRIPESNEAPFVTEGTLHLVGILDGKPCITGSLNEEFLETENYKMIGLRDSYDFLPEPVHRLAGKAGEIIHWDRNTRFCSACGSPARLHTAISKICTGCGKEMFPQITPAILVLVKRGEEILLVHARNFRSNLYSLVAGFVETGENLEECVQRELREETSLEVRNIRYFGSQEWPYPSGIMIGFIADYVSGDLYYADGELTSGGFYSKDNLPELPQRLSLARRMINAWLAGEVN